MVVLGGGVVSDERGTPVKPLRLFLHGTELTRKFGDGSLGRTLGLPFLHLLLLLQEHLQPPAFPFSGLGFRLKDLLGPVTRVKKKKKFGFRV